MCLICFISYLVPLLLGSLFVCRNFCKKCTNQVHRRQMDMAGGLGPTWPHRSMPCGVTQRPLGPTTSLICGRSQVAPLGGLPHCWSMSVWSKGQGEPLLDPWAHCHTLEGLHWLKNWLLTKWTALPAMQLPLGAIQGHRIKRRCIQGVANGPRHCPTPKEAPPPHLVAYNYPLTFLKL
jgi:hypothetical protein